MDASVFSRGSGRALFGLPLQIATVFYLDIHPALPVRAVLSACSHPCQKCAGYPIQSRIS